MKYNIYKSIQKIYHIINKKNSTNNLANPKQTILNNKIRNKYAKAFNPQLCINLIQQIYMLQN